MFSGTKVFLLLACSLVVAAAPLNVDLQRLIPMEGESLRNSERMLQDALVTIAAENGPNYTISKLHSANGTTDGQLTKINVDLNDQNLDLIVKNCQVTLSSLLWMTDDEDVAIEVHHGVVVIFECEGRENVVRSHKRIYRYPYKGHVPARYG